MQGPWPQPLGLRTDAVRGNDHEDPSLQRTSPPPPPFAPPPPCPPFPAARRVSRMAEGTRRDRVSRRGVAGRRVCDERRGGGCAGCVASRGGGSRMSGWWPALRPWRQALLPRAPAASRHAPKAGPSRLPLRSSNPEPRGSIPAGPARRACVRSTPAKLWSKQPVRDAGQTAVTQSRLSNSSHAAVKQRSSRSQPVAPPGPLRFAQCSRAPRTTLGSSVERRCAWRGVEEGRALGWAGSMGLFAARCLVGRSK